ncbi:MAG: glycosyltransferase family 39 protein, partial [bacterium]
MRNEKMWKWMLCAAACLLAALVYLNTIPGDFLWDDLMLVRDNPYIKHPAHLHHLVQKSYYSVFRELTYRPVCTLTYFVDFALWGLNPRGFHITNIVFHFLNVLLLFIFARRLSGRYDAAFVAAVLFAVHPAHSEAVAGITFREDILCLLFVLLSLNFYLSARREKFTEWKRIVFSLVCFFLAVFSKETAVVLPAVVLMIELCVPPASGGKGRRLYVISVYAAAAVMYLVFRLFLFRNPSEHWVYHGRSFIQTMNLAASALLQYFKLLIFPVKQCVQYMPSDISYGIWGCLFAIFLLFLVLLLYFKFRDALFGLVWFLLFLLPVSNIIPIGVIMAERY